MSSVRQELILDPEFSVTEIFSGEVIDSEQKAPAYDVSSVPMALPSIGTDCYSLSDLTERYQSWRMIPSIP